MDSNRAPVRLYPYQRTWVGDQARYKIARFCRQSGKTFSTTLEIVTSVLDAAAAGCRERWVILSRGERQAREAMDEGIKRHAQAFQAAFSEHSYDWQGAGATYRADEVVMPGGSRITALPANPDTARGYSANVFLDEFAHHQDSRAIWAALFPVVSRPRLKLRIASTPNGITNKFHEIFTATDSVWSRHSADIHQAVADGLPRDIAELRRALNDDDIWAQEYELQWLDEASAWLPLQLIMSCEDESAGRPDLYDGGPCYIGVDIGTRRDLYVIWVCEQVGDVLWTREIIARQRISFAEQDQLLREVFARYRVVRCCIDQTGMGEKPVEDATMEFGAHRIEGITFTQPTKLTLATQGKSIMESARIRFPLEDFQLRSDLHKLRRIPSATGAPRFVADADGSGHADRAWACFLAVNAAADPIPTIEFMSTHHRRTTYTSIGRF